MFRNRAWLRHAQKAIDLCYFAGSPTECEVDWLKWSAVPVVYGMYYGLYEEREPIIRLERRLAHPSVPDYVVIGMLHHEMLHHRLGHEHDERFVLAEKVFSHHTEVQRWDHYVWHDLMPTIQKIEWKDLR